MINFDDPRSEHILAHPYFLRGIEHERERILKAIEENNHHFVWIESDVLRAIVAGTQE